MILYHGTGFTFDRFYPNSFFTDSYAVAAQYAAIRFGEEEYIRVIQVEVQVSQVLHIPASCLEMLQWNTQRSGSFAFGPSDWDIAQWLEAHGADMAIVHDLQDIGGAPLQYVVRDPNNIRFVAETCSSRIPPSMREAKYLTPVLDNLDLPF